MTTRPAPMLTMVLLATLSAHAGGALVRNAKSPAAALEKATLKKLYSGRSVSWPDGTDLKLILNAAGTKELAWLAEGLLGLPEKVVLAKIRLEIFNGTIPQPPAVRTRADCLDEVKKNAAAICAVDDPTSGTLPPGIEVLKVTGAN